MLVQGIPESGRGRFSATETALQNLFELTTFASTMLFPRPEQFLYPVLMSIGSVVAASACFAAFVRQRRGHLLHASKCLKRQKYTEVSQVELEAVDH